MITYTLAEVIQDLAASETPNRLRAITALAHASIEEAQLEKKITCLEDYSAGQAETINKLRRELEAEQGKVGIVGIDHKKTAAQLVTARDLLADWLCYNDTKKNADIAGPTRNFLKELSE